MLTYWRNFEFSENSLHGRWVQCCSAAQCCSISKTESGLKLLNRVHFVAHFSALSANKKSFMAAEMCQKDECFSREGLHNIALLIIVRL